MARRKKKLSRRQLKKQQQRKAARIRRSKGWTPPKPETPIDSDLLEMIRPLVTGGSEQDRVNMMIETMAESMFLIDEPEFEHIFFDPMTSLHAFIEAADSSGLELESWTQLQDDELEDIRIDAIQAAVPQLLTQEVRQEILTALNKSGRRFKRERNEQKAAQVALLQLFLQDQDQPEIWSMAGLVHAIAQKSIATAVSLFDATQDVVEMAESRGESPARLIDEVAESDTGKKISKLLTHIPGLTGFMEKQVDKMWDEGLHAVFIGKLHLGLFDQVELEDVAHIVEGIIRPAVADGLPPDEILNLTGAEIAEQVNAYLTEMITPGRLEQLRIRINKIADDQSLDDEWVPFVHLLQSRMEEDDALEYEMPFLNYAAMGEMRSTIILDHSEE